LLPTSYTLLPVVLTAPSSKPTTLNPSASVTPIQKLTALPNYTPIIEYNKNRIQFKSINHTIHNTKSIEIKYGRLSSGAEPKQLILTQVDLYDFLCVNQFENSLYKKGIYDLLGILKHMF